jgi:hypothetical protein
MSKQNPNIRDRFALVLACTLFALAPGFSSGCASGGASSGDQPQSASAPSRADAPSSSDRASGPVAFPDAGWTIVLAAFSGPDARRQALAAAETLRTRAELGSVRVQDRGRGAAIVTGSYRSPGDAAAQRDLARIRAITINNGNPFSSAFLAPPIGAPDPGATPQYHLSRAFVEFGAQSRYTLQIAVYESPNQAEARRAAEQAATQLRAEGEPAFYYHGPSRSMVTLGAFTAAEAGLDTGLPGPILAEFQRRHPYNVFNGRQLLQRIPGQSRQVPQPSFLVEIPRE